MKQMAGRIHRSSQNKMILGVCGGLGETFGVDPNIIRVVALALIIPFHVFTVLAYLALGLLLPKQ